MKGIFDNTIGVLEQAIRLRSKRNSVLAGNIANVDTPGYRPRDMKFKKLMESYMERPAASRPDVTHPDHLHAQAEAGTPADQPASVSSALTPSPAAAHRDSPLSTTDPRHFPQGPSEENPLIEISTEQGTPNSVDLDREMAKLAANNLQYQAGVSALIKKFEALMTAITEGGRQ